MNTFSRLFALLLAACLPMMVSGQFLAWDYHDIITDVKNGGVYPDMAVDGTGKIHISYWNPNEDRLIYAFRAAGAATWTREYVDVARPNGYRSAIALDAANNPHVVYLENVNWITQVRYAFRGAGGGWTVEEIPGDSVRGWGPYGPNASTTLTERVRHSVDITFDEVWKPQVVFFDGWMASGAFPACLPSSDYGFKLQQAYRTGVDNWVVRDFGHVPDMRLSCSTNADPDTLPKGDRYGEYCDLVMRSDSTLQVFAMSRFNNRLISFRSQLPVLDTVWNYVEVDSQIRMLPGWEWADRWYTVEGISAEASSNDDVHVAYTTSLFYGENFCCTAFSNDLWYARTNDDTTIYHQFGVGTYRNHTDIKTIDSDSIYLVYADLSLSQFNLQQSTDGGMTWVMDTIANGVALGRSPLEIVGDSLVVLMYDAQTERLMLGHRHLTGGDWRVEVINASENHGQSIDGTVFVNGGDTTVFTAFNDGFTGKLFFSSGSDNGGWNFTVEELDSAGGNALAVSLALASGQRPVVVYGGGDSLDLSLAVRNGSVWSYSVVDTGSNVQFTDVQISSLDTVHIVYYNDNENCLKYAKRHLSGGAWEYESVDCGNDPVGMYPSLALDAFGAPHVAYYDAAMRSLKYAVQNLQTRSWGIDSVNGGSSSAIGKFASLRLSASGLTKIAYLDEQATSVLLSERNLAGTWTHSVVDSVPITNIGRPIDLEIDSYGKLWVAYNYFSNFDKVKLMHRDSVWQEVGVSVLGQIANAFVFRILGGDLHIIGKKNELQNNGVAMLRAGNGIYVTTPEPIVLRDNLRVVNYPNPFNGKTTFRVEVEQTCVAGMRILDLYGREVAVLMPMRKLGAGVHTFEWDASQVGAGIYLCTLEGDGGRVVRKVMVER